MWLKACPWTRICCPLTSAPFHAPFSDRELSATAAGLPALLTCAACRDEGARRGLSWYIDGVAGVWETVLMTTGSSILFTVAASCPLFRVAHSAYVELRNLGMWYTIQYIGVPVSDGLSAQAVRTVAETAPPLGTPGVDNWGDMTEVQPPVDAAFVAMQTEV